MENFSFIGLNMVDIITILVGIFAFLAVLVVWSAMTANPINKRLKLLAERKDALRSGIVAPKRRATQIKKADQGMGFMKDIVDKLTFLKTEQTEKIVITLMQAGYRNNDALIMFTFGKITLPFFMMGFALTLVYGLQVWEGNTMGQIGLGAGLVLLGYMMPNLIVSNTTTKRKSSIQKALPDALDLMVICAEAGLTLDASMTRVASEMGRQSEELSDEFGLAAIELGFLSDRREALYNLTNRVPLKAVRSVVATLIQTEKYGTPLAHSLRVLSQEMRNDRMMKAEEKAARLPAIMTIPLIMFILPMLFIILLGPAACSIADNVIGRF